MPEKMHFFRKGNKATRQQGIKENAKRPNLKPETWNLKPVTVTYRSKSYNFEYR